MAAAAQRFGLFSGGLDPSSLNSQSDILELLTVFRTSQVEANVSPEALSLCRSEPPQCRSPVEPGAGPSVAKPTTRRASSDRFAIAVPSSWEGVSYFASRPGFTKKGWGRDGEVFEPALLCFGALSILACCHEELLAPFELLSPKIAHTPPSLSQNLAARQGPLHVFLRSWTSCCSQKSMSPIPASHQEVWPSRSRRIAVTVKCCEQLTSTYRHGQPCLIDK